MNASISGNLRVTSAALVQDGTFGRPRLLGRHCRALYAYARIGRADLRVYAVRPAPSYPRRPHTHSRGEQLNARSFAMTEIVKGQELTAVASPTNTTDLSAVADAPAEADAAAEEAPAAEKDEEELAGGHVPMLDLACPDEMGIPEDAPEVPGDGTEMTAMVAKPDAGEETALGGDDETEKRPARPVRANTQVWQGCCRSAQSVSALLPCNSHGSSLPLSRVD